MSSQFQPYLESIRATYEKWWQLYTLTDAAGRQRQAQQVSPTFDFGLMVQTVKKEERREEEKIERFPVLEGIRRYAEQHVLLVGRPGSGKSTALARLMLEEATTSQAKIPVLVELRYWQGSIEQLIRDSFTRHDLPAELFEEALKRSLILFDGVNELPSEEARSQLSAFRRNHPKLPMIFTTRDLSIGGALGIEQRLEMQPLTEAQMQAFIRAYVLEQAEAMLRQLKDRLREFGQTPLLLWMLCGVFRQTGTIPENLGLVFREFTQGYERYLKDDVGIESDRDWWKPVLQQLAWVMMQGEKPTEFRVAISREEAVRAIAQFLEGKRPYAEDFARKCLRDLQKHHLIQVGTNQEELEFRHQLIQEYYAAEALFQQLPSLNDGRLKQEYLNFLKWTQPMALMLSLVEDEVQAVRVVTLGLDVDLVLGARLAGQVKAEFQKKTVEVVEALEISVVLKCKLLGATHSDSAVSSLLNILLKLCIQGPSDDSYIPVVVEAAEALETIGSVKSISALLFILNQKTKYSFAREEVISALAGILVRQEHSELEPVLSELLNTLHDSNDMVRTAVVRAIGRLPFNDSVYLSLVQAFEKEENEFNKKQISRILRDIALLEKIEKNLLISTISTLVKAFNNFNVIEDDDINAVRYLIELDPQLAMTILERIADENLAKLNEKRDKVDNKNTFEYIDAKSTQTHGNSDHEEHEVHASVTVLPALLEQSRSTDPSKALIILEALNNILATQDKCKYYNYKIYQDYLKAQKADRQTPQNSDRSPTIINNFPNATKVEQTIMSNSSKYNFPNAQKVQIFEQVNTYNEHNHSADPETKTAIVDLQFLLTQLQTQHPQVTTESQALTILNAEFTEIQQSTTHPLVTLRQQLLNPERHLQAIKATLAEIAKHYLEESVWSKAAITYLDKLSETPDQGA